MSEGQPPSLPPLAPASDAALVIRERGAELVPRRRSRLLILAGMVVAGLGVVGAVIVSGSALPFLLLGPLMAGGLLLARRAEPSAARHRFEGIPLIAAADCGGAGCGCGAGSWGRCHRSRGWRDRPRMPR